MMREMAKLGRQTSRAASVPPPVGGWNKRDALANMDEKDAVILDNIFPGPSDVMVRKGYQKWATEIDTQVESLLDYSSPAGLEKLFAAAGDKFYDVSSGGSVRNYTDLSGVSGTYWNTPDSAALNFGATLQLDAYIAPDSFPPAAVGMIVAQFETTANQRSWRLGIRPTGIIQFLGSTLGTATDISANSSVITGFSSGQGMYLRMTYRGNDGAGGTQIGFNISTTATGSWTSLGSVSSAGTTSLFNSSASLEIGSSLGGGTQMFDGRVYSVSLYDAPGGTLKVSFNANDAPVGSTSFASAQTSEVWTAHGTASVLGNIEIVGQSNAQWQHTNFTAAGGATYLYAVNGTDKPWLYDGTSFTTASASGVTANNFVHVNVFKQRLWFVEKNTMKAWYLNTGAITGTASAVDLSGFTRLGGYLMAMGTWTLDAGAGVDDYAVFVTSKGEVLVFQGTDPTSSTTWSMKGRWELGSPIGRRCLRRFAGDLLLITVDGVVPLSRALISSRVNPRVALTDKIQGAMADSAALYSSAFGWDLINYPKGSMLLLNIPVSTAGQQQQYAMNTITGSWGRFLNIPAQCWVIWQDEPYFGGDGFVGKFWSTFSDDGSAIDWEGQQAFNYFKSRGQLKQFHEARPVFQSTGMPATQIGLNIDYDTNVPSGTLSFSSAPYAAWDVALWDQAVWGGGLSVIANWQGVSGVGVCAALHILGQSSGIEIHWMSTDYVIEPGGLGTM